MILAALPLVAGLTGCKSDDELSAKPANETLIVEGGDVTFSSSEDKKYVAITADCSWHVVDFQADGAADIDESKSQQLYHLFPLQFQQQQHHHHDRQERRYAEAWQCLYHPAV